MVENFFPVIQLIVASREEMRNALGALVAAVERGWGHVHVHGPLAQAKTVLGI